MSDRADFKNNIASNCIVATIVNKYGTPTVNVQIVPQSIVGSITSTAYENNGATDLCNLYTAFSNNDYDDEADNTLPSFEDSENINFNVERSGELKLNNPDGKDFATIVLIEHYNQDRLLNFGIVGTVGGPNNLNNSEIVSMDYDVNEEQVRSVGFKLPMYVAGPGYSMAGRPIPSLYDEASVFDPDTLYEQEQSTASGDIIAIECKKNTFMEGGYQKPRHWKAGPLDVRWDEYRKVWAACPNIVQGYLCEDIYPPSGHATRLGFTSGEMVLFTGQYNNWKKIQPEQRALVINRNLGFTGQSGSLIVAEWMPNGEYWPMWVDCSTDPSGSFVYKKGFTYLPPEPSGEIPEEED